MYTFGDALKHVFRDVRGGTSPTSGLVKDRVNQALAKALKASYGKGEFNAWDIATDTKARELLLPPEIEVADLVTKPKGGGAIRVRPQWFSFVTRTYTNDELGSCEPLELDDAGDGWIQETELDCAKLILAISEKPFSSENAERQGQKIHLQGLGADGKPVWDEEGRQGFALTIQDTRPKVSEMPHMAVKVKQLTAVQKPVTNWPVILYGYDPVSETDLRKGKSPTLTLLARLMPWETTISRRKYVFKGGGTIPDTVRVFGRLRFRPLSAETDVLPIQDLETVRQFVMQLEAEKRGELGEARYHGQQAKREIDSGLKRHLGAALENNPIQVVNDGSSGFADLRNL